MSSNMKSNFNPGDLVLVDPAQMGMPPYPAVVVAPPPSVRPKLMTSIVHAQRPHRYYWVDTDRLELVQRGGQ